MKQLIWALIGLWLSSMGTLAQESATDTQIKVPSLNLSGTIAVTNTFQSIQVVTKRRGCSIQNNGAATMWVFFEKDPTATCATNAAKSKSVVLTAGQSVSCNLPGVTLSDQICITGTATQEFFAAVQ